MPDAGQWWVFLGASALFAVLPGPGLLYVLARSLRGGRADGLRSVLGNAIGACVHVVAAAVGLSALLAASALAFTVLKIAGAIYLVYLGVRMILRRDEDAPAEFADGRRGRSLVVQGMLAELMNPKTAVFFLAFLPHFVDAGAPGAGWVFLLLGVIVVAMAVLADLLVAVFAGPLGTRLARHPRWQVRQRVASGATMIGIGGLFALAERG